MMVLVRYGQEHLLAHWDTLNQAEQTNLYNEIKVIKPMDPDPSLLLE